MSEPSTPIERAQYVAHLMGGNGLSQNQQVELIAAELEKWSRADCFRAAGVMDPCDGKTPQETIERLVWYRSDGWQHGGHAVTWRDYAEELDSLQKEDQLLDELLGKPDEP